MVIRFHRYCVPLKEFAAAYVERLLQLQTMVDWVAAGSLEPMIIEQEER